MRLRQQNPMETRQTAALRPVQSLLYYFYSSLLSISIRLSIHLSRALSPVRIHRYLYSNFYFGFRELRFENIFSFNIGNVDIDREQRTELDCNFIERPGWIYIKMADCRLLNDPPQILVMEYS